MLIIESSQQTQISAKGNALAHQALRNTSRPAYSVYKLYSSAKKKFFWANKTDTALTEQPTTQPFDAICTEITLYAISVQLICRSNSLLLGYPLRILQFISDFRINVKQLSAMVRFKFF